MAVSYLIYLAKTLGCSRVKCKMASQSFAFFFKQVLAKPYHTPPVLFKAHEQKLPAVLSQQEMLTVLTTVKNIKHRMLLSFMYSTGMRLSEMADLKIQAIDSKQMRIRITAGKGKKDRYVPLSPLLLNELRCYYIQYRPEVYLFNGAGKGKKYAPRTIQHIMQLALAKAGLKIKTTVCIAYATTLPRIYLTMAVTFHSFNNCSAISTSIKPYITCTLAHAGFKT